MFGNSSEHHGLEVNAQLKQPSDTEIVVYPHNGEVHIVVQYGVQIESECVGHEDITKQRKISEGTTCPQDKT